VKKVLANLKRGYCLIGYNYGHTLVTKLSVYEQQFIQKSLQLAVIEKKEKK
jgi:hypothetical protein